MSKPIKNLIVQQYKQEFGEVDGVVLMEMSGIPANDNNALRSALAEKGIHLTVVKNALVKIALQGTGLEQVGDLLDGPIAFCYGQESVVNVAREMIDQAKQHEFVNLKGAVMEGAVFGPDQVEDLSKYPTREEAISKLAGVLLGPAMNFAAALQGPGKNIGGAVKGPASQLAGAIKAIEQKQSDAA